MEISGWGMHPRVRTTPVPLHDQAQARLALARLNWDACIARGLGRSYGDSALSPVTLMTPGLDRFVAFDPAAGLLTVEAGVSLRTLLEVMVPQGWFPKVTPGTSQVTVGGAVACDVHGKNHHGDGTFADHVQALRVATVEHGVVDCSRTERPDLFHATCGGMGLTGIILQVTMSLHAITSAWIDQTTLRSPDLKHTLALFEAHHDARYSVAWIDCLARGRALGRSLLMLGDHADDGRLTPGRPGRLAVPLTMPGCLLNRHTIAAFNALYYRRVWRDGDRRRIHYKPFFYPLDAVENWNRLYGRAGFMQYQFVLPRQAGLDGVGEILERIVQSGRGSFLAVLKAMGRQNDNHLSFPMEGYTLALDFQRRPGLETWLHELDAIVLRLGGRLYLAKDACMTPDTFRQGYPRWKDWQRIRQAYGGDRLFHSLQSRRLGL